MVKELLMSVNQTNNRPSYVRDNKHGFYYFKRVFEEVGEELTDTPSKLKLVRFDISKLEVEE